MSAKEEKIELEGEATKSLRGSMFRITLDNGHDTVGYLSGKMRRHRIRILPGDRFRIPRDLARGRITYGHRT